MRGATEYTRYLSTGQYGRLYIQKGSHARGDTLHIHVIPEGVEALEKARSGCMVLIPEAVEVYGIISGNPGWTEVYGWLHRGQWEDDFSKIIEEEKAERRKTKKENDERKTLKDIESRDKISKLLNAY